MEEKQAKENKEINIPYVSDVAQPMSSVEAQNNQLTSTNVKPTKSARISAHSLKWTWEYKGKTQRKPDKLRVMRGWIGKIYYWDRCTIILNVKTMELYTRSRPYTSTIKMVYATWSKADLIARAVSKAAEIAITPIHTEHPADLRQGHLVVNDKRINKALLPGKADSEERRTFIGKNEPYPSAVRVGAIEDGSHPGKLEFVGKESVEGGMGLDWLLLDYPSVVRQSLEMNKEFSKNLELHLEVLREIRDAVKRLGK
jgi:hypothetical protein